MSNLEVLSAVHGIAPRSDELLRLGTDLERGRIDKQRFDERRQQETEDWLQLQTAAGIDLPEDGKLYWQDHLRPIVKGTDGFAGDIDNAPVTRWFEDNRFYRKPTIQGRLHFNPDKFEVALPKFDLIGANISLLSSNSFAALCDNEYDELPPDRNVFSLYSELLFYLEQGGVKRVLLEDYLPSSKNILDNSQSLQSAQTLAEWSPELRIALIAPGKTRIAIPFSSEPTNLELSVENGTLNHLFKHIPPYSRPGIARRTIWQQVIDSSTTNLDILDAETWPVDATRELRPERLVLTHSVDLECLPLPYAQEKVKRLGDFTINLREKLEAEL